MSDQAMPNWEKRYRAPTITLPVSSPQAPDHLVYVGTESGVWQVHTWDRATGARRQVTSHPVGVVDGTPTLDGSGVLFWQDESGDESGQWFVQPFGGGESRPFLEGIPHGWQEGFAQAPGVVAAGVSDRDGFAIYVSADGAPAKELARSTESLRIGGDGRDTGGLSADGTLLCLVHSEHGDLIHPALRVVDPRTGAVVGEQRDEGMALSAACWSPVPADQRLAIVHEREGEDRPGIWDLASGVRTDLVVDLPGLVSPIDWWPDGSSLLLSQFFEGRNRLYRYELGTGALSPVDFPDGVIGDATVRPDGTVWASAGSSVHNARVLAEGGEEVIAPEGDRAPEGRPFVSWHFENEHGHRVHGFYVTPPGDGPFPVMMLVHGGPTWFDSDRFYPEAQAYVDAGFAVGLVNYRGSVGYGREWRDTLIGNIGGPELEDVNAGLRDLVARGLADPGRAVIAGWSWGGYTTLMELGKHSELWLCGVAGIPVGDY
jgi:Prolyl oligopeptidase family